jgi:hypothetical protein
MNSRKSFYRNWFSMWWEMNVFWLWRWHCENLGSISQVQICSFFTIFFVIVFKLKFSSSHGELSMTSIRLLLREHICACCIMGRLWLFLGVFWMFQRLNQDAIAKSSWEYDGINVAILAIMMRAWVEHIWQLFNCGSSTCFSQISSCRGLPKPFRGPGVN